MSDAGFSQADLAAAEPRFVYRCVARFQDIDAAGFLFFARAFDLFHDAWHAFIAAAGIRYADVVASAAWGMPIRRCHAEYLAPIRFGDALEVGIVRAAWDRSTLRMGYRVEVAGGALAAVGVIEHVAIEMATRRRMPSPPELLVRAFAAIEPPP